MKSPLKNKKKSNTSIAFFGTPRFTVFVLEELEKAGMTPDLIVTAPDRPAGRGLQIQESPVKEWAVERNIAVVQPENLRADSETVALLQNSDFDLFIVAGYGKILPGEVVKLPRYGSLNVHPSLLPKYRGTSPIESQILADDREMGVSVMLMDEGMDHGPILAQASVTPDPWPLPTHILEDILWQEGGKLLVETIPLWLDIGNPEEGYPDRITPEPQDHSKATFTKKMRKEDGLLDLAADGNQNYLKFCAYDEWPGTYFFIDRGGKKIRVKINDVEYSDGTFTPTRVTPEGKKTMDYKDFLRSS